MKGPWPTGSCRAKNKKASSKTHPDGVRTLSAEGRKTDMNEQMDCTRMKGCKTFVISLVAPVFCHSSEDGI